jgi:hypothetical protein
MTAVRLSKLHATGNDFLVWSWLGPDASGSSITSSARARRRVLPGSMPAAASGSTAVSSAYRSCSADRVRIASRTARSSGGNVSGSTTACT